VQACLRQASTESNKLIKHNDDERQQFRVPELPQPQLRQRLRAPAVPRRLLLRRAGASRVVAAEPQQQSEPYAVQDVGERKAEHEEDAASLGREVHGGRRYVTDDGDDLCLLNYLIWMSY
jgi:hypothetical protein